MTSNEIQNWVDPAMYAAEAIPAGGPRVHLLWMTPDPLGAAAACNAIYEGKVKRSLGDVTRAEREAILGEMAKTILTTPMEAISLHFLIEGVTRGFTHQLVRNRTSGYAQESMRFAVVGEEQPIPVALPPSLVGGRTLREMMSSAYNDYPGLGTDQARKMAEDLAMPIDRARWSWDQAIAAIQDAYQHMVNSGIPAEDARGLLPTNIQTRIHWVTNLRSLQAEAGKRLTTQAQFEWKAVVAAIARAIREYNPLEAYATNIDQRFGKEDLGDAMRWVGGGDRWQYEAISDLFRPICYKTGKCEFMSSIDRSCTIRDRVQANAGIGRPSSEWDRQWNGPDPTSPTGAEGMISAISPEEWLMDPTAAR